MTPCVVGWMDLVHRRVFCLPLQRGQSLSGFPQKTRIYRIAVRLQVQSSVLYRPIFSLHSKFSLFCLDFVGNYLLSTIIIFKVQFRLILSSDTCNGAVPERPVNTEH